MGKLKITDKVSGEIRVVSLNEFLEMINWEFNSYNVEVER